jgi:hypothetical protein
MYHSPLWHLASNHNPASVGALAFATAAKTAPTPTHSTLAATPSTPQGVPLYPPESCDTCERCGGICIIDPFVPGKKICITSGLELDLAACLIKARPPLPHGLGDTDPQPSGTVKAQMCPPGQGWTGERCIPIAPPPPPPRPNYPCPHGKEWVYTDGEWRCVWKPQVPHGAPRPGSSLPPPSPQAPSPRLATAVYRR